MVTIPKKWRSSMGLEPGSMLKASHTEGKIILEIAHEKVPYRVYTAQELRGFLEDDRIDPTLSSALDAKFAAKKK